ncbi:formamidopyrimidine-DNA glycosylase [Cryptococcus sp. DSM 104549]
MPELPEVERARKLIEDSCKGYKIKSVDTTEDTIVYAGTSHSEFAKEITGRTITGCERKGKTFWMTLLGEGRLPVMHFGMTGMIQLKGEEPTWYRRRPKEMLDAWPPRFWKFVIVLEPQDGSVSEQPRELAFIDGRRLGRLKLVPNPVTSHPPVSALGFDPVLNHPTLDEFKDLISKKKGTVKGMIMDQAFSAGVGNWVADEVLYQARIHPSCPVPALSDQNIIDLHHQLRAVPLLAVSVNADSKQFPEDWLFRWRWGKGTTQKKQIEKNGKAKGKGGRVKKEEGDEAGEDVLPEGKEFLALPDGGPATIEFIEVGGRTTAIVKELQKMPQGVDIKPKVDKGGKGSRSKKRAKSEDSDDGPTPPDSGDESEVATPKKATTARQKAAAAKKVKAEVKAEDDATAGKENGKAKAVPQVRKAKASARRSAGSNSTPVKAEPSEQPASGRRSSRKKPRAASPSSSDLSDVPE